MPLTPELVTRLEEVGVNGIIATPWFFSREDISPLETKKRLLERYAKMCGADRG